MAEISWIKLKTDMFDNDKIKIIESLPDGDTLLIIWIKLLTHAGKTNANGFIMISEDIALTDEDMAIVFNRPLNTIRLALEVFKRYGMITLQDNTIKIKNWDVYQNVDGMARAKELNKERQRKFREKKKLELAMVKEEKKDSNVTVTLRNAIDKDIDKDIDKENNIKPSVTQKVDKVEEETIPYSEIINYLNERADKNFKCVESTKKLIRARWNEGQRLDDFKTVIDNMVANWDGVVFKNGKLGRTYLQPSTLFGGKFEEYRNQVPVKVTQQKQVDVFEEMRKEMNEDGQKRSVIDHPINNNILPKL